ncbi:hypothetical protein AAZX31_10G176200 [Glycine max]
MKNRGFTLVYERYIILLHFLPCNIPRTDCTLLFAYNQHNSQNVGILVLFPYVFFPLRRMIS